MGPVRGAGRKHRMDFHVHTMAAHTRNLPTQECLRKHRVALEDVSDFERSAHQFSRTAGLSIRSRTRLVTRSVPSTKFSLIFFWYAARRDSKFVNRASVGWKLAEKSP